MNITYNNLSATSAHNLVTFSDIPNILEISDTTGGTKATLELTVGTGWTASENNEYWLTFMGNTISNIVDPKNAVNKNFYIASDTHSTAVSITNALRNCPTVSASFLVYTNNNDKVICKAREIGEIDLTVTMSENLSYITTASTAGTADSSLIDSKITVDVTSDNEYITTLEKYYHGDNCRFDVTPLLATMAEYNKTIPYTLNISTMNASGTVSTLGSVTGNTISVGYMVNQGLKYIEIDNYIKLAQNVTRGKLRDAYNNSILYVSADATTIPVSYYTQQTGTLYVGISYKDSAFNEITSTSQTQSISNDGWLHSVTVNVNIPADCFYVDLYLNNINKLRFNVIRPMKTSYDCQRIFWVNSYGGTSFIDLVGEKTIENTSETVTYNKNHLDYYTNDVNEKEIVYDVDTKTTYTIKSHLMELDGTWQYFDLLQSPRAWTTINGETYLIIIESVSKQEQNNNDVYEMTVKFIISQPTTL